MSNKILTEFTHERQVVRFILSSPKGNLLDSEMMSALQANLENLKTEPQVKLIQFTGSGNHFCFGASVPEHTRENAPQMLKQFHALFISLIELSIPTAALVSGQCLGGGMELALMCNFLFLDSTARMGQPEISLAVFAPPASIMLPLKIGQSRADDLLLTGRSIKPDEALSFGLAQSVHDTRQEMLDSAEQWTIKHILPKSASSLRIAQKASRYAFNQALREQLVALERMYADELMNTHDANEGITSFLEKRSPVWKNR